MKDVFDKWLDEERKATKRVKINKIFHVESPFARLFNIEKKQK